MTRARAIAACLAIVVGVVPGEARGQGRSSARNNPATRTNPRTSTRPRASGPEAISADRITLAGGGVLLGQLDDSSPVTAPVVLARREAVRLAFPDRAKGWEDAERAGIAPAIAQRRERLAAWRRERPAGPVVGDRITAWLDYELARPASRPAPTPLMAIRPARGEVAAVERRSEPTARVLRAAWLLGLADPEGKPPAILGDAVAGSGMTFEGGEAIPLDRLLPPSAEPIDRWLLRRAATEALHDEGLRYIRFGGSILPEPDPGVPPGPASGASIVEGAIRDALGVGGADPLPGRLRAAAARGRVGLMVTTIAIAPDLGSAEAESTLHYRNGGDWDKGMWRSSSLRVGAVPPAVVSLVAADPQVKAVMDLIDSIGGGLVSPEMKGRGLAVGTTAGGSAALARTALFRSLSGMAFDLDSEGSAGPRGTGPRSDASGR